MQSGGEFTSPNQERFHHYKVQIVSNNWRNFCQPEYKFWNAFIGLLGSGSKNKPVGATEL